MTLLKEILAATDFSSGSIQAVARGFLLAKVTQSRLTVVHALGFDAMVTLRALIGEEIETLRQRLTDEAREELLDLVSDPSQNQGISAGIRLEAGLASAAIPGYAETMNADLLVAGAHGSGFFQRILLGSTASRLLRKSKCPVLVVKQPARKAYQRVLVAVDFSSASRTAIHLVRELAPDADILLLHIFEVPFESKLQFAGVSEDIIYRHRIEAREHALHQLHELAKSTGLSTSDFTGTVVYGDTTRQILEHERKYNCDLLVSGKHGFHVTEELLLGSVTKRLLAESESDVLVVVDKSSPAFHVQLMLKKTPAT